MAAGATDQSWESLTGRLSAVRSEMVESARRMNEVRLIMLDESRQVEDKRARLRTSMLARLHARLESQPVIEQAKGVLIARTGCSPDEAFAVMRRASQRTNVRVQKIAEDIVARAASGTRERQAPGPGSVRPERS